MWVACKSYSHFFSKYIRVYTIFNDQSFNDTLTNDIVSFEELGPYKRSRIVKGQSRNTFMPRHRNKKRYGTDIIISGLQSDGDPTEPPRPATLAKSVGLAMARHEIISVVVLPLPIAGLGGSVRCAVRLETRRSRVQPPPRSATFFCGDWSWNIFYGHSLPSADSRRAVVSFWRKNVHNTG